MREEIAKVLTKWMYGKRQNPLPVWEDLSASVKDAYLEQADDVIALLNLDKIHSTLDLVNKTCGQNICNCPGSKEVKEEMRTLGYNGIPKKGAR